MISDEKVFEIAQNIVNKRLPELWEVNQSYVIGYANIIGQNFISAYNISLSNEEFAIVQMKEDLERIIDATNK